MRGKRNAAGPGPGPQRRGVSASCVPTEGLPGPQAGAPNELGGAGSIVNTDDELVFIDRFGHLHTRSILRMWPDRVREVMGVRPIGQADPTKETGHAQR
jgi:hypothetical protein